MEEKTEDEQVSILVSESESESEEEEEEEEEPVSEESESEEEEKWIPLSSRPEWPDVTLIPQDDGPNPVAPIAYTPEFRECMDFFRAVFSADERSPRALDLTSQVIKVNAGNYTVWHFRRKVLESLDCDLKKEMLYLESVASRNYKNYQVWHHRRWIAERLGSEAANSELMFTLNVLIEDAKNYHAWSHLQWALRALGGWENELAFCDMLLDFDVFNNSAWNQRYFVITKSPLLGGLTTIRDSEVDYCIKAIIANPDNESPWRYMKGLYKDDTDALIKNPAILDLCIKVLGKRRDCTFALSFILDLLCYGLMPTPNLFEIVSAWGFSNSTQKLADFVCKVLEEVDPMRSRYWIWRKGNLPNHIC